MGINRRRESVNMTVRVSPLPPTIQGRPLYRTRGALVTTSNFRLKVEPYTKNLLRFYNVTLKNMGTFGGLNQQMRVTSGQDYRYPTLINP